MIGLANLSGTTKSGKKNQVGFKLVVNMMENPVLVNQDKKQLQNVSLLQNADR